MKSDATGAALCAVRLQLLADPTRLVVVRQLLRGPRNVGRLCGALRVEQSLLSHHLRVLREAGLVHGEREGREVIYRLADGVRLGEGVHLGCCSLSFDDS